MSSSISQPGDLLAWLVRVESQLAAIAKRAPLLSVSTPPSILRISEAAVLLRVSEKTIRRFIEAGELKATALVLGRGRTAYRIKRTDLDAFLDGRQADPLQRETKANSKLIRVPKGLV